MTVYRNYHVDIIKSREAFLKRVMNNSLNSLCNSSINLKLQLNQKPKSISFFFYHPSFPSDKYSIMIIILYFKLILGEAIEIMTLVEIHTLNV